MSCLKEKAVILVHGYGYDKNEWGNFFVVLSDILQKQGFCVYRFDFKQTTITDEIKQLDKIIKKMKEKHDSVFLAGMSTGALVSILSKESVTFKILMFPVINAEKTFRALVDTKHDVSIEWLEDCKQYNIHGSKLEQCFLFYSDKDEYIEKRDYESIVCNKLLLKSWSHGPSNKKQMNELGELVASKLESF
ncbi:lysophospholipase [archaeon]|nr:lysophospholipase [archaeon]